jgi:poly-gamma-glutamate capsule biosynthesis protein CapA/YwtB (metallophosphatase superfamily)
MQKFLFHSILYTSIFILSAFAFVGYQKHIISQISADKQAQMTSALNALPKNKPLFSMLFVGDVMLDRGIRETVETKYGGDYLKMFDFIKTSIARSDVSILNLEGPASDKGSDKYNLYSFRMDPDVLKVLRTVGFNVISFTNNHVGDWGRDAFNDTIDRAGHKDFTVIGAGLDYNSAKKPIILEKSGIKVGFLGFSDVGPNSMESSEETSGILLLSDPNLESIIKEAKKDINHLVVVVHWGEEYRTDPTERQIEFGRRLVDWGVTVVVGHHPHVIEPTEKYKNGFIAYSLGNFIFDQHFSKETMEGEILEITLNKNGIESSNIKKVVLDKDYKPSLE